MRLRKLFTKERGKDGEGRQANIKHILLPEEVVDELRLYKDAYSVLLSREKDEGGNPIPIRVSWEQMFRRWMENVGRFDKDVKEKVEEWKHSRKEFSRETMQAARKAVEDLAARAEENGTSLKEEALKEQERAKAELEELRAKRTEKRFVHPDGRWYRAEMGSTKWVPVNPDTGKWMKVQPVLDEGFKLKDVEL